MTDTDFALPDAAPAIRLGPNPAGGRDLVVGDVHGHFPTLRHALAELEFGAGDRLFSLGDLVDRGPASFEAKAWIEGSEPGARFDLVIRGNHEQLMLDALASGPLPRGQLPIEWEIWFLNGGAWWEEHGPGESVQAWMAALAALPFAARIETSHGPVGLVHACPVHRSWEELEAALGQDGPAGSLTRMRALWSRIQHGTRQPEIGERGGEYTGPVEGVRAVVTGHTPVPEPVWRANVLDIDTGIARPDMRRLTIARIDTKEIETWTFDRVPDSGT